MANKFEIFISYRRKGGYDTAKLLYDRLRLDGYSVSFDIDTLQRGNFDKELENRVRECKDFLVVLNPGIFDRFYDPNHNPKDDWVRREIACALIDDKNIVPLVLDGFEWPKNPLPPDVSDLTRKNGIDLNPKHFEAAYANLKQKFLISQPHWVVKHKKKIISILSVLSLAIITAVVYLYFAFTEMSAEMAERNERAAQRKLERQQERDSLAREMEKKDSIIRYRDSLANVRRERRMQDSIRQDSLLKLAQSQAENSKIAGKKSSNKSLHWIGTNDAVGREIFEKLIPTGIQKTACSGNGININVTKPDCEKNEGKVECSYSPSLVLTDCSNKLVDILNINTEFRTGLQNDEAAAKRELANELRNANFSNLISKIEKRR